MANSKTTKKALLSSILALTMCVAMLIATTFAWFTDTASTSVNKIQAGTLDVGLYYKDTDGNWQNAEGKDSLGWVQAKSADGTITKIIEGTDGLPLWEPGCTFSLPKLKIVNKGNLALKYKIIISGITGDAKLNEVIEWKMQLSTDGTTYENENLGTEHSLAAKPTDGESANYFTISGHMKEDAGNAYQGLSIDGISITVSATQDTVEYDSTTNDYDKNAVLPVSSKAVGNLVVTQTDTTANAIVESTQTLKDGVMTVTYPEGVELDTTTVSTGTDNVTKSTVEQSLDYKNDAPSEALTENSISIGSDKAVAQYELTLPVSKNNKKLVTATINYTKDLTGVIIYHEGRKMETTAATPEREYAVYNKETGEITLHLFHASPIDIVYNKPVTLPKNAKVVSTIDDLEAAVGALHDGDYIALGANIATNKYSGQITFERAEGVTGEITATLDMNGHVFSGQIGGFSFANDGITVNVYGNEKALAEFYKHQEGHLVNTFAVFNYSGKTVLKNGLFTSNNIAIGSYGGEIVVDGGEIEATGEGTLCLYAVNKGTVTINGGRFTSPSSGALVLIESTSQDPTVVINGGEFNAAGNAFVFEKTITSCGKCKVIINGGHFTLNEEDGIVGWAGDGATKEWAKKYITITGGTFNINPSAYLESGYKATNNNGTWTVTKG